MSRCPACSSPASDEKNECYPCPPLAPVDPSLGCTDLAARDTPSRQTPEHRRLQTVPWARHLPTGSTPALARNKTSPPELSQREAIQPRQFFPWKYKSPAKPRASLRPVFARPVPSPHGPPEPRFAPRMPDISPLFPPASRSIPFACRNHAALLLAWPRLLDMWAELYRLTPRHCQKPPPY